MTYNKCVSPYTQIHTFSLSLSRTRTQINLLCLFHTHTHTYIRTHAHTHMYFFELIFLWLHPAKYNETTEFSSANRLTLSSPHLDGVAVGFGCQTQTTTLNTCFLKESKKEPFQCLPPPRAMSYVWHERAMTQSWVWHDPLRGAGQWVTELSHCKSVMSVKCKSVISVRWGSHDSCIEQLPTSHGTESRYVITACPHNIDAEHQDHRCLVNPQLLEAPVICDMAQWNEWHDSHDMTHWHGSYDVTHESSIHTYINT